MAYNSIQEIYDGINAEWPDNTTRLITPERLRQVVHDIVEYFGNYSMYKPTPIPIGAGPVQEIPLTADLLASYGRFPEPMVFFGDDANGYVLTQVPWSVDLAPPNTTKIILDIGSNPPPGFVLLK